MANGYHIGQHKYRVFLSSQSSIRFFIIIICIGQHSYTEQFSKDVKAMKDTERQGTAPD